MRGLLLAAALALAGCAGDGDFLGAGGIGSVNTRFITLDNVPTVAPEGTEAIGYRNGKIVGAFNWIKTPKVTGTGIVAIVLACGAKSDCIKAALMQE